MSKVMIVENEAGSCKLFEKMLQHENLDIESVADSPELLKMLKTAKPDLVLLDLAMPELNGIQVMKKLREIEETFPVLVMTARNSAHATEALEQGAVDYIAKPVNAEELRIRVQRALGRRPRARASLNVPLPELHDLETGRIDARRVAESLAIPLAQLAKALNANYQTVYKTPAGPGLQEGLRPIKQSIVLLSRITRSSSDVKAWLNNPHPDLGGQTPMETILSGRADALVTLLESALAGIPS